jgi:Domain of unknown function (DUF4347)/RTX calcium-binding nonapeptide repeat (4 copies)
MTFHLSSNILIADSTVADYQSLVHSVGAETEVIVLNAEQDGVEQITEILKTRHSLQTLHILSHGEAGALHFGNVHLNGQTLERYTDSIQRWATAFAQDANVLLYGCKVAAGEIGQRFVQRLSQLTGVNIAASTTLTGNAAQGGDWTLAFTTGRISSPLAFSPDAMQAYGSVLAPTFLTETFSGADVIDKNWLFGVDKPSSANPFLTARSGAAASAGGLPGTSGVADPVGQGALRLTNANNDQAAYVLYNKALPGNAGLKITFDLYNYGGTGADGTNFFLIDGAASPTKAGAFGGSLGYANRTDPAVEAGVVGGYLGIGFDEFGNYSNPTEGRTGAGTGSGFVPDAIAIRGSESSGYKFLTNSALPFSIDTPGASATRAGSRRRVEIEITQTGLLSVSIDGNQDNDFNDAGERAIQGFQVSPASGTPPASFKFGFAAGTGANTNIHEIQNLSVVAITDAPETANAGLNLTANSTAKVTGLSATDADGISLFTINSLPDAAQGSLFLGDPARGGTAITVGQTLTPAQITQVFFRSTPGFNRLTTFTYSATDTLGAEDATPGVVSVAPIGTPLPTPVPAPIPPDEEDRRRGCRPGEELAGNRKGNRIAGANNVQDRIFGRRGNDKLRGEGCADLVNGGLGNDNLSGGSGSDKVKGRRGKDRLKGNDGNDTLMGQQSNDIVRGGKGDDKINAGVGDDRVNGGLNNDSIRARRGKDLARGGGGKDVIRGQEDNDKLLGGQGGDTLIGGQGADVLIGGRGADVLFGKAGADQFVFRSVRDRGDLIRDFEVSRDVMVVSQITSRGNYGSAQPFADYIKLVQSGANTIVRVDGNGDAAGGFKSLATLVGVNASSLGATNFVV